MRNKFINLISVCKRNAAASTRGSKANNRPEIWYENEFSKHRKHNIVRPIMRDTQIKLVEEINKENVSETSYRDAESNKSDSTFHQAIKPLLRLGQCFGLVPIQGISKPHATSLKFVILDFRFLYTCIIITVGVFMSFVNICWIVSNEIKFDNMSPLIWFGTYSLVYFSFIIIARRWPKLMVYWEEVEHNVSVQSLRRQEQLQKSVKRVVVVIFVLAALEHILSIVNGFYTARKCRHTSSIVEGYFRQSFPAYFFFFSYNLISGCFWQLLNLYFAFAWNFIDSFVIIFSLGLVTQFRQFNDNIHQHRGQVLSATFWDNQRKYYTALSELMLVVDDKIAIIILISFGTNLYYVCLQLFNSVNPSDTAIRALYFWYSLCFLIGRTLAVSFCASKIHDESRKPIEELRLIPTQSFTREAKRLLEQVTNSTIALSGFNFFYITRTFILNVAGTVITYELVLVQLHKGEESAEDPCAR